MLTDVVGHSHSLFSEVFAYGDEFGSAVGGVFALYWAAKYAAATQYAHATTMAGLASMLVASLIPMGPTLGIVFFVGGTLVMFVGGIGILLSTRGRREPESADWDVGNT